MFLRFDLVAKEILFVCCFFLGGGGGAFILKGPGLYFSKVFAKFSHNKLVLKICLISLIIKNLKNNEFKLIFVSKPTL